MNYKSRLYTAYKIARHPGAFGVLTRDLLRMPNSIHSDLIHLQAAMQWLCRAQDATGSGGVSVGWSVKLGWLPPYPETTGYLIPTFLRYASFSGETTFLDRAIKMGAWELEIQMPSGAFPSSAGTGGIPLVFDTAQALQGLTALFRTTNDQKWLDAATRAARWIISVQESDGCWIEGSHKNIPHTYYTRVAWPLFELAKLTGIEEFKKSAQAHITWVLSLRHENGWIDDMGFSLGENPLTHTLAYTYEGLFECMTYTDPTMRADILETIKLAMSHIIQYERRVTQKNHGLKAIPAFVDKNWNFYGSFSCLVGNAQLALLLLRLHEMTCQPEYHEAATNILNQVKSVQVFNKKDKDLYGGIGGALPFWGGYGSLSFINWAGKFFADALILKSTILDAQREYKTS